MSSLSIAELHAKAADLRNMAQTARTLDTREALLRLAARYAQLAQERMAVRDGADGRTDAWRRRATGRAHSPADLPRG